MNQVAAPLIPSSARTQPVQPLIYSVNGGILSRIVQCDSALKWLLITLSGSIQATFGSGTPLASAQSTFHDLVSRIEFYRESDLIKSVTPHMMRMQQLFTTGILATRRASAAATPASDNYPTVDGPFVFGTTTQYSTVRESILVSFEMPYADPIIPGAAGPRGKLGRESTYLNLKGKSGAELRLITNLANNLIAPGNTAPVTFGNSSFQFDITLGDAPDVPAWVENWIYKQITKEVNVSGETNDGVTDLPKGNALTDIMVFAQDGAPGSATTATGKLANNLLLKKLGVRVNGRSPIQDWNAKDLQDHMRSTYGISAPMASNVSILDGVYHINLLAKKDLSTALPVAPPSVDNVQLTYSTNSGSIVTYGTGAKLTIMSGELVAPR